MADPVDPGSWPVGQPRTGGGGVAAFDDVEELTVTDQLRGPNPVSEPAPPHERGLVQPEHGDLPDPVGIIDQGGAVGDHGTVDRVPIALEIGSDFADGSAVAADLFTRPACGPVGDPTVADHDARVDLHPSAHRTGLTGQAHRTWCHTSTVRRPSEVMSTSRRRRVSCTVADVTATAGRPSHRRRDLNDHRLDTACVGHVEHVDVRKANEDTAQGHSIVVHRDSSSWVARHPQSCGVPVSYPATSVTRSPPPTSEAP